MNIFEIFHFMTRWLFNKRGWWFGTVSEPHESVTVLSRLTLLHNEVAESVSILKKIKTQYRLCFKHTKFYVNAVFVRFSSEGRKDRGCVRRFSKDLVKYVFLTLRFVCASVCACTVYGCKSILCTHDDLVHTSVGVKQNISFHVCIWYNAELRWYNFVSERMTHYYVELNWIHFGWAKSTCRKNDQQWIGMTKGIMWITQTVCWVHVRLRFVLKWLCKRRGVSFFVNYYFI